MQAQPVGQRFAERTAGIDQCRADDFVQRARCLCIEASRPQHPNRASELRANLAALRATNVTVFEADGTKLPPELTGFDRALEEAALDLGARPWQVFWLVTLPMIGQALLSAFLLTFTLSLDDVVLSAFLSGPGATTMPLVIFSRARLGLNPSVNAVATIIIAVVAIGVVIASFLIARNERRRALDAAAAQRPEPA